MTDPIPLFPVEHVDEPPERCPSCGQRMKRISFARADCVSCSYAWRRSAQIASDEAWPTDVL